MHPIPEWKLAKRPNYVTNTDKAYPYSECPFLGEYHLNKLPISLNDLIEHVDYWGEGKISTVYGISGFADCYNVNHTYQLVSNGPDVNKKIPNRIPVVSYTDCNTSAYIKRNSVKTVTIMGSPIHNSCAKDIARIVNTDIGKVVAYGYDCCPEEIKNLITELKKISLFHCPNYNLPTELQGLTLFDSEMAFLNLTMVKEQLYNNVIEGAYDTAVELTKNMDYGSGTEAISEVVTKLIRDSKSNIMAYGYKLWNSGGDNIIIKCFPVPFQQIFKGDVVTIVNKEYQQALKLDSNVSNNDRPALGDQSDRTSRSVSWKFYAIWENDNVVFKIYNMETSMYLKLDENTDSLGDRQGFGSTNDNEINHLNFVEPMMVDEVLVFRIINYQFHQALKMSDNADSNGSRPIWGYNGDPHSDNKSLNWIIALNTTLTEKEAVAV